MNPEERKTEQVIFPISDAESQINDEIAERFTAKEIRKLFPRARKKPELEKVEFFMTEADALPLDDPMSIGNIVFEQDGNEILLYFQGYKKFKFIGAIYLKHPTRETEGKRVYMLISKEDIKKTADQPLSIIKLTLEEVQTNDGFELLKKAILAENEDYQEQLLSFREAFVSSSALEEDEDVQDTRDTDIQQDSNAVNPKNRNRHILTFEKYTTTDLEENVAALLEAGFIRAGEHKKTGIPLVDTCQQVLLTKLIKQIIPLILQKISLPNSSDS